MTKEVELTLKILIQIIQDMHTGAKGQIEEIMPSPAISPISIGFFHLFLIVVAQMTGQIATVSSVFIGFNVDISHFFHVHVCN